MSNLPLFKLEAQDGQARAGVLRTAHGDVQTPIFMPVGTRASVKAISQEDLEELGAQIILGNTYHLLLRPGPELIEEVGGGLHGFMSWNKAILTDSGGYQVFSLSALNKVSKDGVTFRSHIDGTQYFLGPDESMRIQRALGPDIVMAFDECPALPAERERLRQSMELTLAWARRCRDYQLKPHQHLFGIVQGGLELDLRLECLERLEQMDFPGLAIGGLSVGEKNDQMQELLINFAPKMPQHKARYLMGVGTPMDIMKAIKAGVDMFDCVLPTRNARNGQALTAHGPLNIKRERFRNDAGPIDPECSCRVCLRYSRAYVRHLFNVGEYLGPQLLTYHNLAFYLHLVRQARSAILNSQFDECFETFYKRYSSNTWQS
jgi:queuine tRNA-ribosyltransferase